MVTSSAITTSLTLEDLKRDKQWVCYTRGGKKVPCNPIAGYGVDCNNPAEWATCDEALSAFRRPDRNYLSIGRMFVREDGITGIDLDHCIDDDGNLTPFAQRIVKFFNSYTEYSPSGHGLHIWVRGNLPDNLNTAKDLDGGEAVEAYDSKRGFTVTEKHLAGTPTTIEARQLELLTFHKEITERRRKAQAAQERDKLQKKAAIPSTRATPSGGNTKYGMKALDDECQRLRTMPEGGRNSQLNTSAFALGQLIAGGELEQATVENDLYNAAAQCGLSESEITSTLPRALEAGKKEPRTAPPSTVTQPARKSEQPTTTRTTPEPEQNGDEGKEAKESVAQQLLRMSAPLVEVFCNSEDTRYAKVTINNHIETMMLSERGGFRRWLHNLYHAETNGLIPNGQALSDVIATYEARAQFGTNSKREEVYMRVAYVKEKNTIYLDMANSEYQVIEINEQGWRILNNSPVCFRRPNGMLPLPMPVRGGDINELATLVNVGSNDLILLKAWVLSALQPSGSDYGEYPILNLHGGQGTAKTSAARTLRNIFDPNVAPLRKQPKDDQSFSIMAHNNFIVGLDNLSHVSSELSDSLCTLSTGAGDAYRKHYTNDEETIFSAKRPQVFTGIEQLATRGDLLDRCILVELQEISDEARIDSTDLHKRFTEAHPRLLGAFLDAAALALKNRRHIRMEKKPRLADFALFVAAAEPKLGCEPGEFMKAYGKNRDEGVASELEASPVASAIITLMEQEPHYFSGSATELLKKLCEVIDNNEQVMKSKSWPKLPRSLSAQLNRLARSLKAVGIHKAERRIGKERIITLTLNPSTGDAKSPTSDAKSPTSDAKSPTSDAKKSGLRHLENEETGHFSTPVTQSDANFIPFLMSSKKEKSEENRERREDTGNLRHFASPEPLDYDERGFTRYCEADGCRAAKEHYVAGRWYCSRHAPKKSRGVVA